jgi:transposase
MQQKSKVFVGLDTSKLKISVAVAEDGRQGGIRLHGELLFCYEAGPTG